MYCETRLSEQSDSIQLSKYFVRCSTSLLSSTHCFPLRTCPIVLTHCGHTVCGLCFLRKLLPNQRSAYGLWLQDVHCPICEVEIPVVSTVPPRALINCPFALNTSLNAFLSCFAQCVLAAGNSAPIPLREIQGEWRLWEDRQM